MPSPPSNLELAILPGCTEIYIRFLVDGRDLGEMVKNAAGENAEYFFDDILPHEGGSDCQPEATVLGTQARTRGMPNAILFACGCGQSACSCVLADVVVTDITITLQNFRSGRYKPSSLAPITFTRANYEAAIADLNKQIAAWKPPQTPPPKPRIFTPPPPEPDIHPDQEC